MSDLTDEINTELDGEILDEQITEATREVALAKERVLAYALARGYDGVDITLTSPKLSRQEDFRHGFEWDVWNGEPEPLEPYTSRTQRYDFRGMGDCEKRQLLAHIGMTEVPDHD